MGPRVRGGWRVRSGGPALDGGSHPCRRGGGAQPSPDGRRRVSGQGRIGRRSADLRGPCRRMGASARGPAAAVSQRAASAGGAAVHAHARRGPTARGLRRPRGALCPSGAGGPRSPDLLRGGGAGHPPADAAHGRLPRQPVAPPLRDSRDHQPLPPHRLRPAVSRQVGPPRQPRVVGGALRAQGRFPALGAGQAGRGARFGPARFHGMLRGRAAGSGPRAATRRGVPGRDLRGRRAQHRGRSGRAGASVPSPR